MTNTVTIGAKVTLLAGASNPQPVEWTVAKVGKATVTLTAAGRFPQKVTRELVAVKIAQQSR